jgi:protein disulfide-isomerase A6
MVLLLDTFFYHQIETMKSVLIVGLLLFCALTSADFYGPNSAVVTLTPENFEEKVLKSDEAWIIEFYAPWCGHCKRLTPEWEAAAKALKKSSPGVNLGAVDADKHRELGSKYGVEGFPTLKIFGFDKTKPKEYNAGRQQADIIHAAKHALLNLEASKKAGKDTEVDPPAKERVASGFYEGSDVIELYDDNFEAELKKSNAPWLIEFYAPWCGHCKALTPTWKELATAMGGAVRIAAIDADANGNIARKFGVQGFPTIKFFAPGSETGEEYNGGRSLNDLKTYCEQKAEQYPTGPVVVNQWKDQKDFEDNCLSKLLCVTFLFPHLMDTGVAGRNHYIENAVAVAKKFPGTKVAFGWLQGGDHYEFESQLNVNDNYPTFVAIGAKKKVYSKFQGKFETTPIITAIQKLLGSRPVFSAIQKIPTLESDVALWDGKEYVPPSDE